MRQTVIVEGRFPGQNELVAMNRNGWHRGAGLKKDYTEWGRVYFSNALRSGCVPITEEADLDIIWYEKDRRRDHDNILAGLKFILDGAVAAGFLPDDSQKYIGTIHSEIRVDKNNQRVEITFIERDAG